MDKLNCSCRGNNPNCDMCCGRGYYMSGSKRSIVAFKGGKATKPKLVKRSSPKSTKPISFLEANSIRLKKEELSQKVKRLKQTTANKFLKQINPILETDTGSMRRLKSIEKQVDSILNPKVKLASTTKKAANKPAQKNLTAATKVGTQSTGKATALTRQLQVKPKAPQSQPNENQKGKHQTYLGHKLSQALESATANKTSTNK